MASKSCNRFLKKLFQIISNLTPFAHKRLRPILIIPTKNFQLLSSLHIKRPSSTSYALIYFPRIKKYEEVRKRQPEVEDDDCFCTRNSLPWCVCFYSKVNFGLKTKLIYDEPLWSGRPLLSVPLPVLKGLLFFSPIQTGFVLATPSPFLVT